ncbi:MAG: quinone-dependent dihydroorotate dehydrogenase [Chloroflexaceae bacterium]|jgi:dihydroorotate dehydrogenase|nr:quinone-dependent dihydroorotate dehydrogenase [Chloroflexaceae bacterium]
MYATFLRPLLFSLSRSNAEFAHERTLDGLALASRMPPLLAALRRVYAPPTPTLARSLFGLQFAHPVGLAAGMDKNGVALPAWAALGFSFVEVGTVTWQAQPGNPRPRLFRLPEDSAVINRMGFNNHGAAALAERLKRLGRLPIPLGISLGKSKITPLEHAVADYCASFRLLRPYGDYFAINVSSPNTPGLRQLQDKSYLNELLAALQRENRNFTAEHAEDAETPKDKSGSARAAASAVSKKPILVKIAPDLSDEAMLEVLEVCAANGVDGIIATNTTLSRAGLRNTAIAAETGGLSGRPLHGRACDVIRFIQRESEGRLPIIGVGGIFTADDARRMLDAGASLLQIYTGLVYEGPGVARRICARLIGEG